MISAWGPGLPQRQARIPGENRLVSGGGGGGEGVGGGGGAKGGGEGWVWGARVSDGEEG